MTEPKFCRDCKHLVTVSPEGDFCTSPRIMRDLVTGERQMMPANEARSLTRCGGSAKWFEPKEQP